jgi:hypothetical protein
VHHVNCMPRSLCPLSNILHTVFRPHVLHEACHELPTHARPHTQQGHTQDSTQCTSRLKAGQQKHATE